MHLKNGDVADINYGKKNKQTEVAATAAYRFGNVTPRVSTLTVSNLLWMVRK